MIEFIDNVGRFVKVHNPDLDNDIEFETEHDNFFLSIDQTKQLIEFLTKQIEGK